MNRRDSSQPEADVVASKFLSTAQAARYLRLSTSLLTKLRMAPNRPRGPTFTKFGRQDCVLPSGRSRRVVHYKPGGGGVTAVAMTDTHPIEAALAEAGMEPPVLQQITRHAYVKAELTGTDGSSWPLTDEEAEALGAEPGDCFSVIFHKEDGDVWMIFWTIGDEEEIADFKHLFGAQSIPSRARH